MFNADFYPTPENVIFEMLDGFDIHGKIILEPSAGKGNIVDYLLLNGASDIIACENNADLKKIVATKCGVIADDFLTLEAHQISHIDAIVMNPPFSDGARHILHAWEIAPKGCTIIALCNLSTLKNQYTQTRKQLHDTIAEYGSYKDLASCFADAERKTDVEVALVRIVKPGNTQESEFKDFFMCEDEPEAQADAMMPYNVVRDLVNRYVGAMKIFDEQLDAAERMNRLTSGFYSSSMAMSITEEGKPKKRNEFKKDLQKSGWNFIFDQMNLTKFATQGLRADINKFVEKQQDIPFTMRNIYKMLEIVVGTRESRMDRAIEEVFDKLTMHYHDNRYNLEGWKTNSHYLLTEKFIMPGVCYQDQRWYKGSSRIEMNHSGANLIEDFVKALCFITGDNYDNMTSLYSWVRYEYKVIDNNTQRVVFCDSQYAAAGTAAKAFRAKGMDVTIKSIEPSYGELFDWGYFQVRAFKKGTMHFIFKDKELWARLNQRVAKIKGYPLPEAVKKTQPTAQRSTAKPLTNPTVLFSIAV